MNNFEFLTPGKIIFGNGTISKTASVAKQWGSNYLMVSGGNSMRNNGILGKLEKELEAEGIQCVSYEGICTEPESETVMKGVAIAILHQCDAVIAIGGGSVLDTGKAIAGLIKNEGPVTDYLEGVGIGRQLLCDPVPFIAIPTTSGTGAEVTKNAVITSREHAYKKSFRSDKLLAKVVIVDPELTISLPPARTAASGMDALTQLIESYVSKKSQPMTDALALQGIQLAGLWLEKAFSRGDCVEAREGMSLASLLSGMCLANSGLGAVHGIAASLGAHIGLEHGFGCAILLPHIMKLNMDAAVYKFSLIGNALTGQIFANPDVGARAAMDFVIALGQRLSIPRDLKNYSIEEQNIKRIALDFKGSSMSGNPVQLSDDEWEKFLRGLL